MQATVLDPADYAGIEAALDNHIVSLCFTESPTNPFLRCVDIELVSKLCHAKGAIVCIDGTFATPVLHSATKYIGGQNDKAAY
ncbi:cystathionine gamma-synthase 1, chloroplastic-like [Lactuca sativa]|uniref:cystathionine gamma-synthase 1, chloroplastic-like n=1 Tax=Lactuca sativa TaxID=4236 RepID=UPI0022AFD13F|nr:cystathionine gamma-synthase 1, chloroplastic-like [Lactuca sativa]